MAVMDLRFPEVNLYEFIDANYLRLMTRIHVEDPIEVIIFVEKKNGLSDHCRGLCSRPNENTAPDRVHQE